ncbi:MAG: MFS transporter [Bacteroidetes bacterium]|nr:MFS transporter [Bacteroidota bacterium]
MKIDKKVFSWAMYDWANSAFSTTVMAGFFPIFFKDYWGAGTESTLTTARLGTIISFSSIIMVFMSPILGAISDLKGSKKTMLGIFMFIGAMCCYSMSQINKGDWFSAMFIYGVALLAFEFSLIFYDSLLPSIAPGKKSNQISSLGYSLGYIGGGILFLINVLMYLFPQSFGFTDGIASIKASFITVAVWWGVFTLPLFYFVPEAATNYQKMNLTTSVNHTIRRLVRTFKIIQSKKNILIFLIAFWLYYDGVNTVITMAVDFGKSLNFETGDLISALLLTQFVGFPFALLFGNIANKLGCKIPILFCISLYCLVVIGAMFMSSPLHFFLLAAVIGMIQGGVQALSRSLYSQMIPKGQEGEYFGIYNVIGKFASIIGPLIVGFGAYLTGNPRIGILGLLVLFLGGGILLFKVKEPH